MGLVYVADVNSSLFPMSEIVFVSVLRVRSVSYNCSLYASGHLSEQTANGWYCFFLHSQKEECKEHWSLSE